MSPATGTASPCPAAAVQPTQQAHQVQYEGGINTRRWPDGVAEDDNPYRLKLPRLPRTHIVASLALGVAGQAVRTQGGVVGAIGVLQSHLLARTAQPVTQRQHHHQRAAEVTVQHRWHDTAATVTVPPRAEPQREHDVTAHSMSLRIAQACIHNVQNTTSEASASEP